MTRLNDHFNMPSTDEPQLEPRSGKEYAAFMAEGEAQTRATQAALDALKAALPPRCDSCHDEPAVTGLECSMCNANLCDDCDVITTYGERVCEDEMFCLKRYEDTKRTRATR